jgi:hypothetical protein
MASWFSQRKEARIVFFPTTLPMDDDFELNTFEDAAGAGNYMGGEDGVEGFGDAADHAADGGGGAGGLGEGEGEEGVAPPPDTAGFLSEGAQGEVDEDEGEDEEEEEDVEQLIFPKRTFGGEVVRARGSVWVEGGVGGGMVRRVRRRAVLFERGRCGRLCGHPSQQ